MPQSAASDGDALERGFVDPPSSARPRVWWHWMNGNITKDGISKDLAWMKRIGIGGVQAFDANIRTPQIVDRRLAYMTPEWKDAFRYAAALADRIGLELGIASSPGWSETGGPWVAPKDAMKKLVWSETRIAGGTRFTGRLAPPPFATGPFQAMPKGVGLGDMLGGGGKLASPTFYGDVAVLAVPDTHPPLPKPRVVSASGETLDGSVLGDDVVSTALKIAAGSDGRPPSVTFLYDSPQTIRSARMYVLDGKGPFGDPVAEARLEASDDGASWRAVASLQLDTVPTTIGFAPVSARAFRVTMVALKPRPLMLGDPIPGAIGIGLGGSGSPSRSFRIAELSLSAEPRIDRFETKAGLSIAPDYYALRTSARPDEAGIAPAAVVDLTGRMKPDGSLDWTPPKGRWRILRLGYSLLGTTNHPATPEATGLEVDKFDGAAVRNYLETYLAMYRDTVGPDLIGQHGVRALVTDSIEVGPSNWTPRMVALFRTLRGYDPTPWLPALAGIPIGTRAQSDAFLYDYRRTLADLVASEHYGTIAAVAHEHGLTVYGEALEDRRPTLGDDMAMRSHADIPMAAMWTYGRHSGPKPTYLADDKGAASVAHLYGRDIVAAESLTSTFAPWAYAPADLRRIVDLEFALGINRPVIHTSVHQPVDNKVPGLSLFSAGQFFTRHESWAEMAKPWMDYLARNSFMLQQGRNVADVAYFYGEEGPITGLYGERPVADAPTRYGFDFVNADALSSLLRVENGKLATPGGARYRLLYLGGSSRRMTMPVLKRLAALVRAGATVVGDAPEESPSLGDNGPAYRALVARLWPGKTANIGRGRVIPGTGVEAALASIGAAPDFAYTGPAPDSALLFTHRRTGAGDIYFVANRTDREQHAEARFRVAGRMPRLWHADTGKTEAVSYRIDGNATVVPLDLAADESVFVTFLKPATARRLDVAKPAFQPLVTIGGPWTVTFQPGRGAPASTALPALGSLSEQADPGIKYFSGTATYTSTFRLPPDAKPGARLLLDLGRVGGIAEVRVNGQPVGIAWHAPYRLDIGDATRAGRNTIEVRVANLWVNRLIGDAQPGARKIAYTTIPTYRADAPLRPSGLIGPVTIATSR